MNELEERLELILCDEYSVAQLKVWLDINGNSSDSNIVDFAIDELEGGSSNVEKVAERLSCFLASKNK